MQNWAKSQSATDDMSFEEAYYEAPEFWEGAALTDPLNMERFRLTALLIPSSTVTLLDVGCGNGVFGRYLLDTLPNIEVTEMDRSLAALRHVSNKALHGDVTRIPLDARSYDCVTCLEVIEHLPLDAYHKALSELARVAGKSVIIGVPYRERRDRNMTTCPECATSFNVDLHLRSFDDVRLSGLLDFAGFKLVQTSFPPAVAISLGAISFHRLRSRVAELRHGPRFVSPICPLCGYRPGERTSGGIHENRGNGHLVKSTKSLLRRVAQTLDPLWPKTRRPSYWAICRYERC